MKSIPIVSTVQTTIDAVLNAVTNSNVVSAFPISEFNEIQSFFKYELPEIKILDFGDPNIDAESILKIVKDDPWLLFGGIIAIVNKNSEKLNLELRKEPNFLFITSRKEFEEHAPQLMKILGHHEQFLFNRKFYIDINAVEQGHFVSDNDPFEILFYANLLNTYLYNTNRVNDAERMAFQGTMMELLLNAVEHGNCNITYEEKSKWLEQGKNILELIELKRQDPKIKNKKVYIHYRIDAKTTKVTIRDEGQGFNWKESLESEFTAGLHGMGIKLSQSMVNKLTYNDIGNEVSFEILNQKNIANLTPAILKSQKILNFSHMQIVANQHEESNDIFYISSGKYAVYVDNKLMTVLTPADIFIGEMAFLLDNKRSATIVSIGEGSLIRIKKHKFIQLMEQYPHYGIFLAKLVAHRLAEQSKESARLKTELDKYERSNAEG